MLPERGGRPPATPEMTMMEPERFVEELAAAKAYAILRTSHAPHASPAMDAAVRGGFRIIEFTLNTPGALGLIEEFASRPGLIVGAGTVLTPEDARNAVAAGAQFLVSPATDLEVIAEATRLGVAMLPGAATPTEMLRAHRAGAPLIKLFPGPAGGPSFVRQIKGPLPHLRLVPTSGVGLDDAPQWLAAGAHAVGLVAPLFPEEDVVGQHWDRIAERSRQFLATVGEA